MSQSAPPPFVIHGPVHPELPVILSVPHSGRHYPASLIADAAVSPARLSLLEDRYADLLVEGLAAKGATIVIAQHARALLDLNRDPREIDPDMIDGPHPGALLHSSRVRHGLGLIPRHVGGGPRLWRRKFSAGEIGHRIATLHTPYHAAITAALKAAKARFGIAILLDCHSMPPIRQAPRDGAPPGMVIGDRFGRSADSAFGDLIEAIASDSGVPVARNAPYAGGYSLDLHGDPRRGIHAIQIEVDRSRYLDEMLEKPAEGLASVQEMIARIFLALCDEAQATRHPLAAE